MVEIYLAAVGGRALVLGLFSRKLRDVPLSGPLLAMAVGVVLGPAVAGVSRFPQPSVTHALFWSGRSPSPGARGRVG